MYKLVNGERIKLKASEVKQRKKEEAEHAALEAEFAKTEYQRQRAAEYPSIGDQLDAIWEFLDSLQLKGEAEEIFKEIKAIKEKYDKDS